MNVYRGEKRYLSVDLANALAVGDTLVGTPTAQVITKRGRRATSILTNSPNIPARYGSEIRFWVDVAEDQTRGNYLVLVSCDTNNGETVQEEAPLVIQ